MNFEEKRPPRRFVVGSGVGIEMKDCGTVCLEADEQVTFMTPAGAEYDVARKDWGFYATPSLNGRLERFGLRGVLVRNTVSGRYFVLLVERGREAFFDAYREQERLAIVSWLDCSAVLERLRSAVEDGR